MRTTTLICATLALAGCALRPRYTELVDKDTPGPAVQVQLVEVESGQPVPGATVELGEYRNKRTFTTDAQGMFTLPVEKKYLDDNSILVINSPAAAGRTRVVVKPAQTEPAPLPGAPVVAPVEPVDAGS